MSSPGDSGDDVDPCAMSNDDSRNGLRIGSIFIILVTSLIGTLAPIVLRQSSFIPRPIFEFAKFFGSGVIIATAFIHLLAPAWDELTSECLTGTWKKYDWAPAIAMASVYGIFFAEVAAYRIGTKKLARLGIHYSAHNDENPSDAHAHSHNPAAAAHALAVQPTTEDGHDASHSPSPTALKQNNLEKEDAHSMLYEPSSAEATSQLIGVAVLEFGVILHSVIIGLTLGVTDDFITLFIVIIFHQMFEGLGLGSRLAALNLPINRKYRLARYAAAVAYSICTPLGVAIGIGARHSYNGNGATANIVSGVLDATSAGILLYTGLVELMAHEILLNPKMMRASSGKLTYIFGCMLLGSGLMALLGRWA